MTYMFESPNGNIIGVSEEVLLDVSQRHRPVEDILAWRTVVPKIIEEWLEFMRAEQEGLDEGDLEDVDL